MKPITPETILNVARGFMGARVLLTAAELGVFATLSGEAMSLEAAAARLNTGPRGTAILLDALSALGFLKKDAGKYWCPPEVAQYLSPDVPGSVLPMLMHSAGMWQRWSNLTEVVRGTAPQEAPGSFEEPGQLAAFIGAMHVIGVRMAREVAAVLAPQPGRKLLDVGGATGTYTEAFLEANPRLEATLFDRAPVIELARTRLANSPLRDRITLATGDFYADELPGRHDLVLLSAIIHQNSPEQNLDLYRKCHRAMNTGGKIIIRDHIMNPDRTQPPSGAMFAVNMLVATPGGNTYTFEEIRDALAEAGFASVRLIRPGELMDGLVEAIKP